MVDSDPEKYLGQIQNMLKNDAYSITADDYTISHINDRGKDRELWKLNYFPHRIIQWAVMLQIEHVFNQVFVDMTYASIPKRGAKGILKDLKKDLKDIHGTQWCLKIDIRKYYDNIDHDILKKLLRKKFKDPKLLDLFDMTIDSHGDIGIPIGSYLSQYLGNFYLAYFDHWLADQKEVNYTYRYMDDVVILLSSKEDGHAVLKRIKEYLKDNLKLQLKSNYQVFYVDDRGIDFCGHRFYRWQIILRKTTYKKMRKTLSGIKKRFDNGQRITCEEFAQINAYVGWLSHTKCCEDMINKYLMPLLEPARQYYFTKIKGQPYTINKDNVRKLHRNEKINWSKWLRSDG